MFDVGHRALSQQALALIILISSLLTATWADPATNLRQPVPFAVSQSMPFAVSQPVPSFSSSVLTVVGDGSASQAGRSDFGSVNTAITPRLEHTFAIRNDAAGPLTITRLQPSCGCTSAVLAGTGTLPAILQSGQQVAIRVRINLEPQLSGPFRKMVSVFVAGQSTPAVVLEMVATLDTLTVTATPAVLDFGRGHYGEQVCIPFLITAKNGAMPAPLSANFACSNPDVTLKLSPPSPKDKPGTLSGVATLSAQAHLGHLEGQVLVLSPAGDASALAVLPIQGQVNGDISATPAALTWDTIATDPTQTRRIFLTASTPDDLHHLRISCTIRTLHVHLEDATTLATATLTLSVVSDAKRQVTGRILVSTANGQQLQIPVTITPSIIRNPHSSIR